MIIGHVDSGKSTLMGHILLKQGVISKNQLRKLEKESHDLGKGSFSFAWALDEGEEERERGLTIDVAMKFFETEKRHYTILDAPGHQDFVPNMIMGAAQADCAILVIASQPNEFDAGFTNGGETKEHAILARSLGVTQIVVCVNKLDVIGWSKERYKEISNLVRPFLISVGFPPDRITFVPISGF